MPTLPLQIRQSELLHRFVLDHRTAEEFGSVEMLWVNPEIHRVLGFICRTTAWSKQRFVFKLSQLQSLGAEGLVVNAAPVETNKSQVDVLETLIGHELWSEVGDRLGTLTDCQFRLQTGEITAYLFRSQGWRGYLDQVYRFPAQAIVRVSQKRVLIAEQALSDIVVDQDGLEQKMVKVTQTVTQQTKEQLQDLTEKAGQQVQAIAKQATHRAKALGQSLKEELPQHEVTQAGRTLLTQIQSRAQQIAHEVKAEFADPSSHTAGQSQPPPSAQSVPPKDWEEALRSTPSADIDSDEPWI